MECPECGGSMRWFDYATPMKIAGTDDLAYGHWVCTSYGSCELAGG